MPAGYTLVSNIPTIIAKSGREVRAVNEASANRIAADAKQRAPSATGKLKESIGVKSQGDAFVVHVGAFYGHFIEWGTVRMGPRPFLTPAAEAERENHRKALKDVYGS